jgi:sugar transferase (PEP-CTERM/EpsH1 system associated)
MQPLLYLTHRIPYPPNKGDKITTFHLLQHLAARYRVYLGTFVDDPDDEQYETTVRSYCADLHAPRLQPRKARVLSLTGLLRGEALTLAYYRDAGLRTWIEQAIEKHGIRKAVVYSSAMAQYVYDFPQLRVVDHFADVDSAKWADYASQHRWPLSWIYRREGRKLLAFERGAAARSAACTLVTDAEAALFARLAPECAAKVHVVRNGVDTKYFAPDADRPTPFSQDDEAIVFTGAMDYLPNVDAVSWFVREMLPALTAERPRLRFYIVGMNPAPAVRALGDGERVVVTGRVPDVRPYLQHARVVVAPLRIARGVQNKVLEAMAMQRPVVVASAAVGGVSGVAGQDFVTASTAQEFIDQVTAMLDARVGDAIGRRARARVMAEHTWERNLEALTGLLESAPNVVEPVRTVAEATQ